MSKNRKPPSGLLGPDGQPVGTGPKLHVPPEVEEQQKQQKQEELMMKVQAFLTSPAGQQHVQLMLTQMRLSQMMLHRLSDLSLNDPEVQHVIMSTVHNQAVDKQGQMIPWSYEVLNRQIQQQQVFNQLQELLDGYTKVEKEEYRKKVQTEDNKYRTATPTLPFAASPRIMPRSVLTLFYGKPEAVQKFFRKYLMWQLEQKAFRICMTSSPIDTGWRKALYEATKEYTQEDPSINLQQWPHTSPYDVLEIARAIEMGCLFDLFLVSEFGPSIFDPTVPLDADALWYSLDLFKKTYDHDQENSRPTVFLGLGHEQAIELVDEMIVKHKDEAWPVELMLVVDTDNGLLVRDMPMSPDFEKQTWK